MMNDSTDAFTQCHYAACGADALNMIAGESGHPGDFTLACDAHLAELTHDGAIVEKMVPVAPKS